MPPATMQKPGCNAKPMPARDGRERPVPPAGSAEERAATALVGYPGPFGWSCGRIDALIRSRLLWES